MPHTRPVPIIGTEARPGCCAARSPAGPAGTLRVPSALVSALEIEVAAAGIPALGYFAQVPHYVSGPYATAAARAAPGASAPTSARDIPAGDARRRRRASCAPGSTPRPASTRRPATYVERLEAMYDEQRLPSGDDLISDIERFLRDRGGESTQR